MKLKFVASDLFEHLWLSDKRYVIAMGGRGRGASTAASQYIVSRLAGKEYTRCALMRANHSDIRISIWREIMDRVDEQNARGLFGITDNDMKIEYGRNFAQAVGFRASSGEHTAKLKSLANFNLVVIEEAEEVSEQDFMTLDESLRTVKGDIKVILICNPPPKNHWIIKDFFTLSPSDEEGFYIPALKAENALYIAGTHEDNACNLDEHTKAKYESYRQTKPDHYWRVIRGFVPEVLRGKIYSGWRQIDKLPPGARLVQYGLDFGWYPDPTALVGIYKCDGEYIIDEILYGTELDNKTIASAILKTDKNILCVADSAEPRSIDALKKMEVHIVGAEKGQDSVNFGIKLVSRQKIAVTKRSRNVWADYEGYAWKENKDGDILGIPDHKNSHSMDSLRYGLTALPEIEEESEEEKMKAEHAEREHKHKIGVHNVGRITGERIGSFETKSENPVY